MLEEALIAAGSSLLGGFMRNNSAAKAAQAQMDFQERMSNTAHQREVADLRAAGLNPMLSAKLGGSSTPVGATYDPQDVVSPAVNSALSAHRTSQEVKNMQAQTELIDAQASQARSQTFLNQANTSKAGEEAAYYRSITGKAMLEQQALTLGFPNIGKQGNLMDQQAKQAAAAALRDMNYTELIDVQKALTHANINLTTEQIKQVGQVMSMNLGDVEKARILAGYFKTTPGEASVIMEASSDAAGVVGRFLGNAAGGLFGKRLPLPSRPPTR